MKSKFLSLGMGAILSGGLLSSAFAQSADDSDAARKLSHVIYSAAQRYLDDGDSWGNFENYPEYSFDCREIGKGYGASLDRPEATLWCRVLDRNGKEKTFFGFGNEQAAANGFQFSIEQNGPVLRYGSETVGPAELKAASRLATKELTDLRENTAHEASLPPVEPPETAAARSRPEVIDALSRVLVGAAGLDEQGKIEMEQHIASQGNVPSTANLAPITKVSCDQMGDGYGAGSRPHPIMWCRVLGLDGKEHDFFGIINEEMAATPFKLSYYKKDAASKKVTVLQYGTEYVSHQEIQAASVLASRTLSAPQLHERSDRMVERLQQTREAMILERHEPE